MTEQQGAAGSVADPATRRARGATVSSQLAGGQPLLINSLGIG